MPAEQIAIDRAEVLETRLVPRDVEDVDRELGDVAHVAAGAVDDGANVLARLTELRDDVALADRAPLRVLRDLPGDEQQSPALHLVPVREPGRLHEGGRVDGGNPRHAASLPSITNVSPFRSSWSRRTASAATSEGSMSRPPGFMVASAATASS